MERKPLISIIVPIYQVENYLNRCVESIINQTYDNLEIILVDDGSPDECPLMCDDWAKRDNRITVFHVKNGGAGYARNIGIGFAHGEWTVLVDGDDYLHCEMIEHLLNLVNSTVELAECSIICVDDDNADFSKGDDSEMIFECKAEDALSLLIQNKMFCQTPPNKLYKSSIIKQVEFPEGNLIDDEFWTYKVVGLCNRLRHTDRKYYAYRQHKGSVMHKSYSEKRLQAIEAKLERMMYCSQYYPNILSIARKDYIGTCIYHGQMVLSQLKGEEKEKALNIVLSYFNKAKLQYSDFNEIGWTERIWIRLSQISFVLTCRIRNLFKIGL